MPTITKKSRARIRTSLGDLVLEFFPDKAPRTVENFLNLAHKGFYDGLLFHRVVKDFIVQGGCPKGDGSGGPGYTIRPEFNDTPHVKGTVSMARSADPHSAGSQFFICLADARYLDSRYTAFARVLEGQVVLDRIGAVLVNVESRFKEPSAPRDPIYINGIDLIDIRFEDPSPSAPESQQPLPAPRPAAASQGQPSAPAPVPAPAAESRGERGRPAEVRSEPVREEARRESVDAGDDDDADEEQEQGHDQDQDQDEPEPQPAAQAGAEPSSPAQGPKGRGARRGAGRPRGDRARGGKAQGRGRRTKAAKDDEE